MPKRFKKYIGCSLLSASFILTGCLSNSVVQQNTTDSINTSSYHKIRTPDNFNDYVRFLKNKAAEQGVSAETLNNQNNIYYVEKAVRLDQQKAGKIKKRDPNEPPKLNPNGTTNDLNRVLTQNKVDKATGYFWVVLPQLENASKKYGVQ